MTEYEYDEILEDQFKGDGGASASLAELAPPAPAVTFTSAPARLKKAERAHQDAAHLLQTTFDALKKHEREHEALRAQYDQAIQAAAGARADELIAGASSPGIGTKAAAAPISKLKAQLDDSVLLLGMLQKKHCQAARRELEARLELALAQHNESGAAEAAAALVVADLESRLAEANRELMRVGREMDAHHRTSLAIIKALDEPVGVLAGTLDEIELAGADPHCTLKAAALAELLATWRGGINVTEPFNPHKRRLVYPQTGAIFFWKDTGELATSDIASSASNPEGSGYVGLAGATGSLMYSDLERRKAELAASRK